MFAHSDSAKHEYKSEEWFDNPVPIHNALDNRKRRDERAYPKALLSQQIHIARMIAGPEYPPKEIVRLLRLIANP